MNHNSSARKKLLEYEDDIKREEFRSGFLDRTDSRDHSKFMESILREGLERQESHRSIKRQPSNFDSIVKSPLNKERDYKTSNSNNNSEPKIKPLALGKYDSVVKVEMSSNKEHHKQGLLNDDALAELEHQSRPPIINNESDEVRSARQNELLVKKKLYFKFSFCSYLLEVAIAYGLTFGVLYLIQAGNFPYYEILFIISLTLSIVPWKTSNVLMFLTALPMTIINHFLGLSVLTYPQILLCYIAIMMFNEKHKIKILFLLALGLQLLFGFVVIPAVHSSLAPDTKIFYYLFPLLMVLLRSMVQFTYWVVGYSTNLFLQIPLFLAGFEYGVVLSVSIGQIEFWYLLVFFTLQIMNERTHFFLKVMANLAKFCFPKMKTTPTPDLTKKNNHILPPHSNGFSCIHSFHLVCLIYVFTELSLFASPYSSGLTLEAYTANGEWYKPLVVWLLVSVYEGMCLILEKNKKTVLLYGYVQNRWYHTVIRGLTLLIGFWMFYLGLGIGNYLLVSLI